MPAFVPDPAALIECIQDGASVAVPPDYSGVAIAATRALVAAKRRRLHLIAVPQAGLQADVLIGAGCVATLEAAGINLGEFGLAPRFTAAVEAGQLAMRDATCPAIHAGLQAAEKGIPFLPLRGILGSDLLRVRPDWKVIDNPYGVDDPLVLIPAIKPDFALFHAKIADREGNVWVGVRRELMLMAHAAKRTLVTVETVQETSLLEDPALAAGTIPALYVDRICQAPGGMRPLGFDGEPADAAWLGAYVEAAQTSDGFRDFVSEWLA